MMFDPGYNMLRTQEQLGYKVGFYTSPHAGITGVVIVIQSAKYSPTYLQERVLHFIDQFFQSIDLETFTNLKQALLQTKENPFETLEEEHEHLMDCLTDFNPDITRTIRWDNLQ